MKAIAILFLLSGAALTATAQDQLGALAPANLNKSRPAAPFDITGTWQHSGGPGNPFQFAPPPNFKLTPASQVQYDAAQKARKEGKAYHDDIGQCWPAGLPVIMTRVWPIAMVQKPTAIYMVSAFLNAVRIVYLDGRPHTDPDVVVRTFNGESIGHYEGDTLVVDTTGFVNDHHWIDNGVPVTDALHIVGTHAPHRQRRHPRNRNHRERSQELGRRMEMDQALPPHG